VGIDRDYDSLRQDFVDRDRSGLQRSGGDLFAEQAYLSSLARQSDIDDFAKAEPVQLVEPLETPDWTSRNWDQEARETSAALRAFSEIHESRMTYYLVYATEYLLTSEGTEIRQNRSFCSNRSGNERLADDGVPLSHFLCGVHGAPGRPAQRRDGAQGVERCRYGHS